MSALLLLPSCKGVLDDSREVDITPRYILFSAPWEETKSSFTTSLAGSSFGVAAYAYTSDWKTYKATGTPMAEFPFPTTVSCESHGVCTYDVDGGTAGNQYVNWDNHLRYSFFAYHPVDGGVSFLNSGNKLATDVPKIRYTIPSFSDATQLKDVIISMVEDTDNKRNGTVGFQFHHCLSCIDVAARNFNPVDETISNLQVVFTSPLYEYADIPLDGSAIIPGPQRDPSRDPIAYGLGDGNPLTVPQGGALTHVTLPNQHILIIPQNTLQGVIRFTDILGETREQPFEASEPLQAGMRYTIQIAFAQDVLSLAIIKSTTWTDKDQEIIFE